MQKCSLKWCYMWQRFSGLHPDQSQGHFSSVDFLVPRKPQSQGHFSPRDTSVPRTLQSHGHFSPRDTLTLQSQRHFSPRDTLVPPLQSQTLQSQLFRPVLGSTVMLWCCGCVQVYVQCSILDFKAQKLDSKHLYSKWKLSKMFRNFQT